MTLTPLDKKKKTLRARPSSSLAWNIDESSAYRNCIVHVADKNSKKIGSQFMSEKRILVFCQRLELFGNLLCSHAYAAPASFGTTSRSIHTLKVTTGRRMMQDRTDDSTLGKHMSKENLQKAALLTPTCSSTAC